MLNINACLDYSAFLGAAHTCFIFYVETIYFMTIDRETKTFSKETSHPVLIPDTEKFQ